MTAIPQNGSAASQHGAPAGVPRLDVDPFSTEFFEDPHAIHQVLREAGPLVWLDKWDVYGVARYAEVRGVRKASFSRRTLRRIPGRVQC